MKNKSEGFRSLARLLAAAEKLYLTVVIGLILPAAFLLAGWWGSLPFAQEEHIRTCALGGFLLGLALNLVFLKRWTLSALSAPLVWPALIYLFYSVCVFGFFMGVPIGNFALGPLGGYYMGMRLRHQGADAAASRHGAHAAGIFSALILTAFCAAALLLASRDAYLAENIRGMLNLFIPIQKSTILLLSFFTGIGLSVIEYFLTRAVVRFALFEENH